MPRKDAGSGPISAQAQQDLVSDGIENFELPKALVTRIAKSAIPENSKLQKETVLSLVKGSTVFINYLAATAHDVAISKQHKSISASDVLRALETIEFGDLVDKLQSELIIYRAHAKTDKTTTTSAGPSTSKRRPSSASSGPVPPGAAAANSGTPSVSAPPTKARGGKGKAKSSATGLPPPFTTAPLPGHRGMSSVEAAGAGTSVEATSASKPGESMEVDWEEELSRAADSASTYLQAYPSNQPAVHGTEEASIMGHESVEREFEGAADEAGYHDEDVGVEEYAGAGDDDDIDEGDEEGIHDDEDDNDDDDEAEDIADPMEVEDEELRRDAKGLEENNVGGDLHKENEPAEA